MEKLKHGFWESRFSPHKDHFDAITDAGMLQNDEELNLKINSSIEIMPSKKKSSFQCKFCYKVCLSSDGLKRRVAKKFLYSKAQETSSSDCLVSDLSLQQK